MKIQVRVVDPPKEHCGNCKYYRERMGECHRYPPRLFYLETVPHNWESQWPDVDEEDSCGEFKARTEEISPKENA